MRFVGPVALAIALVHPNAGKADQDFGSGNFMLQHCQHYIANNRFDAWDGECSGTINTLIFLGEALPDGFKICRPKGSTKEQATRVVVNYMQSNPDRLHDPFVILAMQALSKAWPCR